MGIKQQFYPHFSFKIGQGSSLMKILLIFSLKNRHKCRFLIIWWGRLGSNQRPSGYEPPALTPELRPQVVINFITN